MSGFRRYRPLGPSQLERMERRLAAAGQAWSEHWFGSGEGLRMGWRCRAAQQCPDPDGGQAWHSIGHGESSVFLLLSPGQCFEAVACWFGAGKSSQAPTQGVAASERLFEKIFGDLLRRCAAAGGESAGFGGLAQRPESGLDAGLGEPASGAVFAELSAWFGNFLLVIAPSLSQGLSRPEMPQIRDSGRASLTARLEAIHAQYVRLELRASIDGQLTVGAVDDLAVGDVVLLSGKVSEALEVSSPSGTVAARGFLGRRGERRALRLAKSN